MRLARILAALLALLALAAVLASCGGDGPSTTAKTATASKTATGKARAPGHPTYLPDAVTDRRLVKPATYHFAGDGRLTARHLRWHDWGKATATAFGTIAEHPASGLIDTFSGRLTAAAPRRCHGARYYTEVMAHLPKEADYVPSQPTKLTTPCG